MSQVSRLTSIFTGMILLTGGTGLVGSHIAFEILSKGGNVRALKRKGSSTSLTEKIFPNFPWDDFSIYNYFETNDEYDTTDHEAEILKYHSKKGKTKTIYW